MSETLEEEKEIFNLQDEIRRQEHIAIDQKYRLKLDADADELAEKLEQLKSENYARQVMLDKIQAEKNAKKKADSVTATAAEAPEKEDKPEKQGRKKPEKKPSIPQIPKWVFKAITAVLFLFLFGMQVLASCNERRITATTFLVLTACLVLLDRVFNGKMTGPTALNGMAMGCLASTGATIDGNSTGAISILILIMLLAVVSAGFALTDMRKVREVRTMLTWILMAMLVCYLNTFGIITVKISMIILLIYIIAGGFAGHYGRKACKGGKTEV